MAARNGRGYWFALAPGLAMMATTLASLVLLLGKFIEGKNRLLLVADIVLLVVTAYLVYAGMRTVVRRIRPARVAI